MKIIEQFLQGKTGDAAQNEDGIAVTDNFIALFDGVTSRAGFPIKGVSTGRFATDVLCAAVGNLPADVSAPDAVVSLNATLKAASDAAAKGEGRSFDSPGVAPAAAFLCYSRQRQEIWRVADSTFVLDGQSHYRSFPQEETVAQLRRAFLCAKLAKGMPEAELFNTDISWDLLVPIVMELRVFANYDGPFGYGVLNGATVPVRHIEVYPAKNAGEIIFASDGYPEVMPTLAETERYLKKVITEDPLMYKIHPQVKGVKKGHLSYDDRSYIRFQPG